MKGILCHAQTRNMSDIYKQVAKRGKDKEERKNKEEMVNGIYKEERI